MQLKSGRWSLLEIPLNSVFRVLSVPHYILAKIQSDSHSFDLDFELCSGLFQVSVWEHDAAFIVRPPAGVVSEAIASDPSRQYYVPTVESLTLGMEAA